MTLWKVYGVLDNALRECYDWLAQWNGMVQTAFEQFHITLERGSWIWIPHDTKARHDGNIAGWRMLKEAWLSRARDQAERHSGSSISRG